MTRFVIPRFAPVLSTHAAWTVSWSPVAGGSFSVFGVGLVVIRTRLPGSVTATPAAIRGERAEQG
jgi:hypothetical protein